MKFLKDFQNIIHNVYFLCSCCPVTGLVPEPAGKAAKAGTGSAKTRHLWCLVCLPYALTPTVPIPRHYRNTPSSAPLPYYLYFATPSSSPCLCPVCLSILPPFSSLPDTRRLVQSIACHGFPHSCSAIFRDLIEP